MEFSKIQGVDINFQKKVIGIYDQTGGLTYHDMVPLESIEVTLDGTLKLTEKKKEEENADGAGDAGTESEAVGSESTSDTESGITPIP